MTEQTEREAKVVLVCPECYGTDVEIEERESEGVRVMMTELRQIRLPGALVDNAMVLWVAKCRDCGYEVEWVTRKEG